MSYMALALKWRPRTFSQLVGQDPINKTLVNALNQQRLHHAYLFTGTRGVGKTSIARILAKALNCEQGISSEPCLNCEACLSIEQGRFIDLIEIDGASKTRIEDTRELLDNVQYRPTNGRFKIYLIDEVHMLSQHSFNALLKTLEEPPASVKFILATTDPQKLPITVLSRCLQFHLKQLSIETIKHQLELILRDENLDYESAALTILAKAAQGSMRDALSLLDQAITACNQKLLASDVKMLLGHTQQDYALEILQNLAQQEAVPLFHLSQQIEQEGGHFKYVLETLLEHFHQMALYQKLGETQPLISPSHELKTLAKQFSAEDLQLFYQIALKGCEEMHLAPSLGLGFNMTLLRMLTFRPAPQAPLPPLAFQSPLKKEVEIPFTESLDEKTEPQAPREEPLAALPLNEDLETQELAVSLPDDPTWDLVISKLNLTGLTLNAMLNTEFVAKEGAQLTLKIAKGHQSLFTPITLTRIKTALETYYQSPIQIILNTEETVQATPAQHQKKMVQEQQKKTEEALHKDPVFQELQKEFSAELVPNSIVSLKDGL